jgi:hypothetical protein
MGNNNIVLLWKGENSEYLWKLCCIWPLFVNQIDAKAVNIYLSMSCSWHALGLPPFEIWRFWHTGVQQVTIEFSPKSCVLEVQL